jgi:cytochrome c oxidase assembly protein subunit 15
MISSSTGLDIDRAGARDRQRPVRIWLYAIAALVILMVAVGGVTRLTDSGLSITQWKPISGAVPPLTEADWQAEFSAYQQSSEFRLQNAWMTLGDFRFIFWWEWGHRLLGRIIGLAFAVPFVVFLVQKRLSRRLTWPLVGLFILGGFQGFLGWWMVSSGLVDRVDVSQYRLAAPLGAASILFCALIWVARRVRPPGDELPAPHGWRWGVAGLGLLVFVQLLSGAFVAGLDAGYGYNTWPLIDGGLVPSGLGILEPAWRNLFENALAVQFVHRSIAYLIVVYAAVLFWRGTQHEGFDGVYRWLPLLAGLVLLQALLGILTLVLVVPMPIALGHQALAFMLLGAITACLADMVPRSSGF